ncbi:uncharacterized protein N7479_005250 [Penicillium vulpinum]|uniref:Uncharacterized protein n=1 Tax=Penicillium vulpinum TaxID=29845 RepID=A0A1V6RHM1_9EURO|nr:uncharacterized protein N7479_005250 [Penicillium vulpinum]KAJ5958100.1 hypothetical protein N7479_005250 [Penicillium vulpinum]OQE01295.1 hypothetical protein PENVUL_c043G02161 [Penicillium vulpinum]
MPPKTTSYDPDAESSDPETPRSLLLKPLHLVTPWCLQCFCTSLRNWDYGLPFEPDCWSDTVVSKLCSRCSSTHGKRDSIYRGIRGHVFELMALLEFVKQYWVNNHDGFGKPDIADFVWLEPFIRSIPTAVHDLCLAFDNLAEAHGKAHLLIGTNGAKAAYSAWCNAREHAIYPHRLIPENLHQKYALYATEHLRLRLGEETQIHWAAALYAFHDTVEETIRNHYTNQSDEDGTDTDLLNVLIDFQEGFPLQLLEL